MPDAQSTEPRVISLIASATEILHALGMGDLQVGRSHECDWPPAVADLPQLTRPRFSTEGASKDIDKAVRNLVAQALAVYEVDADALQTLAPDVIITQDQCAVCAVSLADVERAVCDLTASAARVVSLSPHSLADVYRDVEQVALALGAPERGRSLIETMQRGLERVTKLTRGRNRARLAFIEWIDPLMSCGHWMPELIGVAGGDTLFGTTGSSSPYVSWPELSTSDPDVVLVAPCGYDIPTTLGEMEGLSDHPLWHGLRAVAEGRAFVADGNAYFNRPGPRLVESAEILAEVMHPETCDFGHRGHAYQPVPG